MLDIIELLEITQSFRREDRATVAEVEAITLRPESPVQHEVRTTLPWDEQDCLGSEMSILYNPCT